MGVGRVSTSELSMGVLYGPDDKGIICLNKPAGLDAFHSWWHRSGYPQMIDLCRPYWPEGAHAHRIDRTTSGVHVWGEHSAAISYLRLNWARCSKTYLAVISGTPRWTKVLVEQNLKIAGPYALCETELTVIGENLIQAKLTKGGRTHQIRKALRSVGFPIVNDKLYGGEDRGGRVFLHNWKWNLDDIEVQAKLPWDMEEWEPGGWTEPSFSFKVPPLTDEQIAKCEEWRTTHQKGAIPWPGPGEIYSPE